MEELILGGISRGICLPRLPCQPGLMGSVQGLWGQLQHSRGDPTHPVCFGSASRPFQWILAGG